MMDIGTALAATTAGIDALYRGRARSDGFLDREGLIPVAVGKIEPVPLSDYAEATDRLETLRERAAREAETPLRGAYLDEMIDSLQVLVMTFEGKQVPFAERVRRQIRVDTTLVPDEILDGYRTVIRERLDDIGFRGGDLAEDVRRWETAARVAPDAVLATMRELSEEARRRVNANMYECASEWLEPVGIENVPFSAYCDYPGRKLLLNLDFPYTRQALKHLAAHEAFPGHLVHLAMRERLVATGVMPADGAQVVTSSASSALFEGIADNGIHFIDWVETPADELGMALMRLRGALRCNAAFMLHAEKRPIDELVPLFAAAGYQTEATVKGRLAFLQNELRAPFVYAYWCGDMAVHEVWRNSVPRERRAEFWAYLYGHMHTPTTLRSFWR